MYLFGDTETTGFPRKGEKVQDGQARICQLALILTDAAGRSVAEFCALIKPDGWEISEGAFKAHGKTMEDCEKYGVPMAVAWQAFMMLASKAEVFVCHNMKFDWNLLDIEAAYGQAAMPEIARFCTMEKSTRICKLPGNYGDYKWPKAEEALRILCGKELGEDAHDAMFDTRACKDIFFALKAREAEQLALKTETA